MLHVYLILSILLKIVILRRRIYHQQTTIAVIIWSADRKHSHYTLLIRCTDAFGRVLYSYKDLPELAGYTARVSLLLDTMADIRKGKFDKALVSSASTDENAKVSLFSFYEHSRSERLPLVLRGRGQTLESDEIHFENVPIVTPNGDVLVKTLGFYVKPGVCDSSRLFSQSTHPKISNIYSLWDRKGVESHPYSDQFILIPQRPCLSLETLRDQIIYPHSKADMEARGFTDFDLLDILAAVHRITSPFAMEVSFYDAPI